MFTRTHLLRSLATLVCAILVLGGATTTAQAARGVPRVAGVAQAGQDWSHNTVRVRWNGVRRAVYRVRVAPSLKGLQSARIAATRSAGGTFTTRLSRGVTYFVQVRAVRAGRKGPWSSAARIALRAPAPAPAPGSPNSLRATMTALTGRPWAGGTSSAAGYTNTPVPASPVLSSAETAIVAALPTAILNIAEYAEPIYYAAAGAGLRNVKCIRYGCVGGASAPLTGREVVAGGTDAQLVVVDTRRRRSYEFYQVAKDADGTVKIASDGSVTVGSMSVVNLDGRGNKTAEGRNLNITGAGVSRIFGVIRANEVRAAATNPANAIPHGLQISLPSATNCSRTFREPATKTDGRATSTRCVQEGARVQMAPTFKCGTVSVPLGRAVCYSLQKYGAYVMDNNGSRGIVFYGQHVNSWSTGRANYAAVGVTGDYRSLGIPNSRLRVLSHWNGR